MSESDQQLFQRRGSESAYGEVTQEVRNAQREKEEGQEGAEERTERREKEERRGKD